MQGLGCLSGWKDQLTPWTPDGTIYRRLVESVTDYAIYMMDEHGFVRSWNAGAERTKAYTAAEIVGRHFSCFYTDEDRASGLPEHALGTARHFGIFEGGGWRVRKDGTRFWANVVIESVRDDEGLFLGFAKITRDMTVEREAQLAILDSERRFRLLVQGVTDYALYMLDVDGVVTNWNAGAERAKGYLAAEIVGQHFSRFFTPEDRDAGLPALGLSTALAVGRFEAEGWRIRKDGSRFWAHVVLDRIHDDSGELIGFAKITRDITRQKADSDRMREMTQTLDLALSNMKQGLCVFDRTGTLRLANRRFVAMFGTAGRDLVGCSFEEIVVDVMCGGGPRTGRGDDAAGMYRRHRRIIAEGAAHAVIETFMSGAAISLSHSCLPEGGWVSTFEDVTEARRAEARISQLASQDGLTGLANRRAFNLAMANLADDPGRHGSCALMLIDLDDFKAVNDTYGHSAGDDVLRDVASTISRCVRGGDLAARLGGDEFAVIMFDCTQADAVSVAERLIEQVQSPRSSAAELAGRVGVSIGIAIGVPARSCAETLMSQADVALYDTKAGGKCGFRVYSNEIRSRISARREMQQDLRHAVAHASGFEIHYQPLVNVETGLETGREALLRWTHPRHGSVAPSVFIPLAEEMGLIGKLGQWVLDRACSDAAQWDENVRVAVNVSARQLGGGFAGHVARALDVSGLPGARLEVEVTESTLLSDSPGKLEDLHQVRALGVSVALDDFGMGFSSLAHLRAFPFDRIKIDGSFVRDAVVRADCAAIVAVIVDLGRRLGRRIVAEGIENEEQLMLARRQGCDEAQGYLLGRPAPYFPSCPIEAGPNATAAAMDSLDVTSGGHP